MNQIELPENDEDLLAQCDVETFRSGGKGGQHQNTTESGVRLRHRPSGVVAESRSERSQHLNKKNCLENLRRKIERLNYRPKKRLPTRIPRRAKQIRLNSKAHRSSKKSMRKNPSQED